jgi:hypothetical protein
MRNPIILFIHVIVTIRTGVFPAGESDQTKKKALIERMKHILSHPYPKTANWVLLAQ